ncbi:MAG: helix-turn-helix transcriptional regulator [Thermoleophilia bacterium]
MEPRELERLLARLEASMDASHKVHRELFDLARLLIQDMEQRPQPVPPEPVVVKKTSGPVLLDTVQAAERLNLSNKTLEQWRVKGGGPPFIKLGGGVRYDSAELEAWVSTRRRRSTSDPGPGG